MRLAVAIFCESMTLQEGSLNALRMPVNQINRSSFPARLGASLLVVPEFEPGEETDSVPLKIEIVKLATLEEPDEVLAELQGHITTEIEDDEVSTYTPVPSPFADLVLPSPGLYAARVSLGDLEPALIKVRVSLIESTG